MRRNPPPLLIKAAAVGLVGLVGVSGPGGPIGIARAGTATNSLSSQTTVSSACNISGSTLAFGAALNPIAGGAVNGSSTLTIECTANTPYTVALNAGINAGGAANFSTRKMINGAYVLGYQLYVDASRTSVWGNSTGGSSVYSGTGTGGVQSVTIYGQVPSLTGAVPGTYTDTVTVTVTY